MEKENYDPFFDADFAQPGNKTVENIAVQCQELVKKGVEPKCAFCSKEVIIEACGEFKEHTWILVNVIGYKVKLICMDNETADPTYVEVFGN